MAKKLKRDCLSLVVYAGNRKIGTARRAALDAEAKRNRRSVSDVIWLSLENGPSKELKADLQKIAEEV